MTADILQREGLEPVKYASSDRLIINYETGMIWKRGAKYIGPKIHISLFPHNFLRKIFYVDIKRFNSQITTEIYADCHLCAFLVWSH